MALLSAFGIILGIAFVNRLVEPPVDFIAEVGQYLVEELGGGVYNTLYELYKAWRDECKVGFNRVDLEKLIEWLEEHRERKIP